MIARLDPEVLGFYVYLTAYGKKDTAIAMVWSQPPIAQDAGYYLFADMRNIFPVLHFWSVLSNIPLLFIGLAGLYGVVVSKAMQGIFHAPQFISNGTSKKIMAQIDGGGKMNQPADGLILTRAD